VSRVSLEPSYVLHARAFRETSLLLEVFTRDHGRLGMVARGARGSRSRWKNMLQPFRPLLLSWSQKGELATLTAADQVASPPPARGQALFCGLYVNELLIRGLHRSDPHPELFEFYRRLLAELAVNDRPEGPLRVFEKHFLDALGFGLQLENESASGEPVISSARYEWLPEGGLVRRDGQAVSGPQNGEDVFISGAALLALQSDRVETAHLRELKQLMRRVLRYHLGEKPLMSHSLFQ